MTQWALALSLCLGLNSAWAVESVWVAPAGQDYTSPEEALAAFHRGAYVQLKPPMDALGATSAIRWLIIQRDGSWPVQGPVAIVVKPAPLAHMQAWSLTHLGSEMRSIGVGGMSVDIAQRSARSRLSSVWVPEIQDLRGPLVVRIETIAVQVFRIELQDNEAMVEEARIEGVLIAAGFSLAAGVFGTAMLVFFLLRIHDVAKGWVPVMVVVASLLLAVNGVLLWPIERLFNGHYETAVITLIVVTIVAFSELSLPLFGLNDPQLPWLKWLRLSTWLVIPAAFIGKWGWNSPMGGVMAWQGPQMLVFMGAAFIQGRRGAPQQRHHLYMGLLLVASVEWIYLGLARWVSFHPSNYYLWQFMLAISFSSWFIDLVSSAVQALRRTQLERENLHGLLQQEKLQLEQRVEARTAELRDALAELQRAEGHQRELLSLASHEFRTPAAMIKSALEVLAMLPLELPQAAQARFETIRVASARLIFLANKLIEHDRWREMSVKPRLAPLELRAWMKEVVSDVPRDMPVMLNVGTEPISVDGDAVLLRIALQNLIDNALAHAAKEKAQVHVSLSSLHGWVHMIVEDNGPGVPDSAKPQVFDRFFSANPNQRHGLGLSIVRAVARLHGGDATVSDAPAGGARFVISLPQLSGTAGETLPLADGRH